jgi:hypothetical protein
MISLAAVLVLSALAAAPGPPERPRFNMYEAARLPFFADWRQVCGDADHDGRTELYLLRLGVSDRLDTAYALEHTGGFQFDSIPLGFITSYFSDLGDPDSDGRADLLASHGSPYLDVYEARSPDLLPDTIVYDTTLPTAPVLYPTITDLDADSLKEITLCWDFRRCILVLENAGDNRYVLSGSLYNRMTSPINVAQTYDLDRDGYPELITGCVNKGIVTLFEAAGDDSFRVVAACTLHSSTGQFDAVGAAHDMDRDGRPEALVFGANQDEVGIVAIFESHSPDSFEVTWLDTIHGDYAGTNCLSTGDIDGDSVDEFAVSTNTEVTVYKCTGQDQYEQVWTTTCDRTPVKLYDIDGDGKCELITGITRECTIIYTYGDSAAIAETPEPERAEPLQPTFLTRAQLQAEMQRDPSLSLFDASGREVLRPNTIPPGIYFVRRLTADSQQLTASRKVLLTR